jgi:hypothetical protein
MGLQTATAAKIIEMLRTGQVAGPVGGKSFDKVIVSAIIKQFPVRARSKNVTTV